MDIVQFYQEMNQHHYRANCYHTMYNPDNDATSGNHHVINATYHLVSKRLDGMYPASVEGHNDILEDTIFLGNCMKEPGIYIRHPNKVKDQQTHDDYVGIITSNHILGGFSASNIYKRGQDRKFLLKYYYDNLDNKYPVLNAWFGRFPWMVALIKKGAKEELNLFDRLGYCAYLLSDVYFNKDKTDTSGRIIQWLANEVMKGDSWMVDKCISKWKDNIKSIYPGKMGEVLGIYHGTSHPFAKAMKDRM